MHRLCALIIKEFRQYRRDRRMRTLTLVAPIIQLTLLGYAVNPDVKRLPVAVCDQDLSTESRRLVSELRQSGYFIIAASTTRSEDLIPLLDRGTASLALHIPYRFEEHLRQGKAVVQLIIDGSDGNSAGIGAGYLGGIISRHGAQARQTERLRAGGPVVALPRLELRPRVLYNPTLESVYFMVPGVMGLVLLVIMGTMASLSIVREREAGTLEQMMVTPIRPWELILGKLIPYAMIATVDLFIVLLVIRFWFHVPLRGSFVFLLACAFVFLLTCFGIGLLVSTVSRTQQQAQMTMFFVMMPTSVLSGFMYPIANMPHWMQPITLLMPMRFFLVIIRSVMLKGSGPAELWPELAALVAYAVGLLGAGALGFRKRLS